MLLVLKNVLSDLKKILISVDFLHTTALEKIQLERRYWLKYYVEI